MGSIGKRNPQEPSLTVAASHSPQKSSLLRLISRRAISIASRPASPSSEQVAGGVS